MATVLDLDAGNVVEDLIIANIDVVRHADVNSCIFYATKNVVFDEAVMAKLGEDAV